MQIIPTDPCPACGATEARAAYPVRDLILHGEGSWTFALCACGHGSLAPLPSDAVLAEFYGALYTPENLETMRQANESGFDRGLRAARVRAIQAALGARTGPIRLLDVGCGLGHFVSELAAALGPEGVDAQGVEFSDTAADTAEEALRAALGPSEAPRVIRRLFDDVALDAQVDVLSMNHFLEHHGAPSSALRRAAGLVRPGGLIEVEVPRVDGWGRRMLTRWWWPHLPPQHVHLFTRAGLDRALQAAGFEPLTWRVSGYPMTLTASWVHRVQFTIGKRSAHAGSGAARAVSWVGGLLGLLITMPLDLIVGPLVNRAAGDIVMVVARRRSDAAPATP